MNNQNPRNETFWILLVIASFLLGHFFTKAQALEQKQGQGNIGQVIAQNDKPSPSSARASPFPPSLPTNPPFADNVLPVSAKDHLRGSKEAAITLIEYSDLECPYCKRFHPTMQKILNDYQGKVNWVYRHFPLSFHQNAAPAALAAECVGEQAGNAGFWQFVDGIFADANTLSQETISSVVGNMTIDKSQFDTCFKNKKYQSVIDDDLASGQKASVNGTPSTFLINNKTLETKLISGAQPYEQVKQIIDSELEKN